MRFKLLIFSSIFLCLFCKGQENFTFTHYSSEDGLSQNTIMSIMKDRKGYMWFATWDGLNKFDGYTFKTYKATQTNKYNLTNNRIDYICEDRYGYIWLLTYDSKAFRFNPRLESFEQVPSSGVGTSMNVTKIRVLANGTVWLLMEQGGAIRVQTDKNTYQVST